MYFCCSFMFLSKKKKKRSKSGIFLFLNSHIFWTWRIYTKKFKPKSTSTKIYLKFIILKTHETLCFSQPWEGRNLNHYYHETHEFAFQKTQEGEDEEKSQITMELSHTQRPSQKLSQLIMRLVPLPFLK